VSSEGNLLRQRNFEVPTTSRVAERRCQCDDIKTSCVLTRLWTEPMSFLPHCVAACVVHQSVSSVTNEDQSERQLNCCVDSCHALLHSGVCLLTTGARLRHGGSIFA
jgi:hypothetical protein